MKRYKEYFEPFAPLTATGQAPYPLQALHFQLLRSATANSRHAELLRSRMGSSHVG